MSKKKWRKLKEFVAREMAAKGIPGVAIGLWYKGKRRTAGFGVTNLDHPLPVTDTTLFQIGSITKTFTALAVMQLVEKGQVELDQPVRSYLPDFQTADEATAVTITVRHLLTHMAGWDGDLFQGTGWGEEALPRYAALIAEQSQTVPLDTHFSYNNAAFSLAGYLIEKVTGQPYETVIREQILTPLGMDAAFFDARDLITHRFAVGHEGGQVARPWYLTRSAYPAGALCCHVRDLLQYGRFQLSDGTVDDHTLLTAAGLAQCHEPQVPIWGQESMALSWFVDDRSGTRIIHHGGATNGQIALLAVVPEYELVLAVLTNAGKGRALTREILEWVMDHLLDAPLPQPEPLPFETEDLRPYIGRFERDAAQLELGILGGRLVGQYIFQKGFPDENAPLPPPPPPMTFLPTGEDEFMIGDGPMAKSTVHAIRGGDGTIGWLRLGFRLHRRVADELQLPKGE